MPINPCSSNGKPGYKFGDSGKCYTYTPGNAASRSNARNKAIEQERAARASGWSESSAETGDMSKALPPLAHAEQMYADAMLNIVEMHGKLADGDENGIWVNYETQDDNEEAVIGVKCSNCYFYEGQNVCAIVARAIEPEGKCRLAAIPPGLVNSDAADMDDDEDEEAQDLIRAVKFISNRRKNV